MLARTQGSLANRDPDTNNISALLETLALFLVGVSIVATILAIATVFQNGFQ